MTDAKTPAGLPRWITDHLQTYLDSGGTEGHIWDSSAVGGPGPLATLLLTTTGRRSGQPQVMPLLYGETDGNYVLIGSKGGAAQHPAWYLNLLAHPEVGVQVGTRRFHAVARTAAGDERAALWRLMVAIYPPFETYQQRTTRQIPVVVLEPANG